MSNLLLGWANNAKAATFTASSSAARLGPERMAGDQGATSRAWQTAAGATTAAVTLDAGGPVPWRLLSVHRTNLTLDGTLRWRLASNPDALTGTAATALAWDSDDGATLGANTSKVGTVADPDGGTDAVEYDSSSIGSSYVRATDSLAVLAGVTYRIAIWARRVSGSGALVGDIIRVQHPDGAIGSLPLAGNITGTWQRLVLDFTPATSGTATIWWCYGVSTGAGTFGVYVGEVGAPPLAHDTGTLSGTVAAGYGQSVHVLPAEVTARFLRLDLSDDGNPQGFICIPLLFGGPAWQPAQQWGADSAETAVAEADVVGTRGGQVWSELRFRRRQRLVTLPLLARAERWPELGALELHAATGGNVLVVPSPEGDLLHEPVFGQVAFQPVGYTGSASHRFRSTQFTVTERL